MTINLDTEVVNTAYDVRTHVHTYVLARNGKRWTVRVPDQQFARFGPVVGAQAAQNKANRRKYLATMLENAMQGDADADPT